MLEKIIQIAILVFVFLLWFLVIKTNDGKIVQGHYYRNYFKTVYSGLALVYIVTPRLMAISFLNLITFLVYALAVISSLVFIPQMLQTSGSWFLAMAIVIVLSVLLHTYVRYINKFMFDERQTEAN